MANQRAFSYFLHRKILASHAPAIGTFKAGQGKTRQEIIQFIEQQTGMSMPFAADLVFNLIGVLFEGNGLKTLDVLSNEQDSTLSFKISPSDSLVIQMSQSRIVFFMRNKDGKNEFGKDLTLGTLLESIENALDFKPKGTSDSANAEGVKKAKGVLSSKLPSAIAESGKNLSVRDFEIVFFRHGADYWRATLAYTPNNSLADTLGIKEITLPMALFFRHNSTTLNASAHIEFNNTMVLSGYMPATPGGDWSLVLNTGDAGKLSLTSLDETMPQLKLKEMGIVKFVESMGIKFETFCINLGRNGVSLISIDLSVTPTGASLGPFTLADIHIHAAASHPFKSDQRSMGGSAEANILIGDHPFKLTGDTSGNLSLHIPKIPVSHILPSGVDGSVFSELEINALTLATNLYDGTTTIDTDDLHWHVGFGGKQGFEFTGIVEVDQLTFLPKVITDLIERFTISYAKAQATHSDVGVESKKTDIAATNNKGRLSGDAVFKVDGGNTLEECFQLLGPFGQRTIAKKQLTLRAEQQPDDSFKFLFPDLSLVPKEIDLGPVGKLENIEFAMSQTPDVFLSGTMHLKIIGHQVDVSGHVTAAPSEIKGELETKFAPPVRVGYSVQLVDLTLGVTTTGILVGSHFKIGGKKGELMYRGTPHPTQIKLRYPDRLSITGVADSFTGVFTEFQLFMYSQFEQQGLTGDALQKAKDGFTFSLDTARALLVDKWEFTPVETPKDSDLNPPIDVDYKEPIIALDYDPQSLTFGVNSRFSFYKFICGQVYGVLSVQKGLHIKASADPIKWDGLFEITDASGQKGPYFEMHLPGLDRFKEKQLAALEDVMMEVSGHINILGASATGFMHLSAKKGLLVAAQLKLFKVFEASLAVGARITPAGVGELYMGALIEQSILEKLQQATLSGIEDATKAATGGLRAAIDGVNWAQQKVDDMDKQIEALRKDLIRERDEMKRRLASVAGQFSVSDKGKAQQNYNLAQRSLDAIQSSINALNRDIGHMESRISNKKHEAHHASWWKKAGKWAEVLYFQGQLAALEIEKGALELSKVVAEGLLRTAKAAFEGVMKLAELIPIEADPRLLTLQGTQKIATAGLSVAKHTLEGLESGVDAVSQVACHFVKGVLGFLDIQGIAIEGRLSTVNGGDATLAIKYKFLGQEGNFLFTVDLSKADALDTIATKLAELLLGSSSADSSDIDAVFTRIKQQVQGIQLNGNTNLLEPTSDGVLSAFESSNQTLSDVPERLNVEQTSQPYKPVSETISGIVDGENGLSALLEQQQQINKAHQANAEAQKKQHEANLVEIERQRQENLDRIRDQDRINADTIRRLQEENAKRAKAQEEENQRKIGQLNEENRQKIAAQHAKNMAAITEQHQQNYAAIAAQHLKNMEAIKAQDIMNQAKNKDRHNQNLKAMEEQHRLNLEAIKQQDQLAVEADRRQHEVNIATMLAQTEKNFIDIEIKDRKNHKNDLAGHERNIRKIEGLLDTNIARETFQHKNNLARIKSDFEKECKGHEHNLANIAFGHRKSCNTDIENIRQEALRRKTTLEDQLAPDLKQRSPEQVAQHDQAIAQINTKMQELIDRREARFRKDIERSRTDIFSGAQSNYDSRIDKEIERYNKQIDVFKEATANAVAPVRQAIEESVLNFQKHIKALHEQKNMEVAKLESLKTSIEDKLSERIKENARKHAELEKQINQNMRQLEADIKEEAARIAESNAQKLAAIQEAADKSNALSAYFQASLAKFKSDGGGHNQAAVTQLEEALKERERLIGDVGQSYAKADAKRTDIHAQDDALQKMNAELDLQNDMTTMIDRLKTSVQRADAMRSERIASVKLS